jgi:glycine oxidase
MVSLLTSVKRRAGTKSSSTEGKKVSVPYDREVPGRDVIVIGAGIIGCAVGRELARRGASVRIFEARTVGAGATQASAGVLAPHIEGHHSGAFLDLLVRSLALYDDFVREVSLDAGIPIEYRRCGSLEIATDDASADRLQAATTTAQRWLTPGEACELEPALPESILGALLAPAHGYVAVPALTDALVWAALKHGAQMEAAHRVAGVRREGSGAAIATDDGTKWSADEVVIAAGCWSGQIDRAGAAAAAVKPIRGQLLRLAWPGNALRHVLWGPDCYVVPWVDGTVLVGATAEDVGFDERATAAGVRDLLDAVCELLPEAWRATFLEARVGLRPATPDGLPIIGRSTAVPALTYATGHFRNGILLAPLTAVLVADLIVDGRIDPVLDSLAPTRFPA